MAQNQTVAVIGAGASGLLTAIHLFEKGGRCGPRVYLIERREGFGQGAAYSTSEAAHLLNVRAANMSAFPDRPQHFIDWLRTQADQPDCGATPACFVSRKTYGAYLQSLLRDAVCRMEAAGRFYLVPDEAVAVKPVLDGRLCVRLALGREITADAVVIATGNPPPVPPNVDDGGFFSTKAYIGDPWGAHVLDHIAPYDSVLLLGTGLTMVDVLLSLAARGHKGPRTALSRRGLLPHRHAVPARLPAGPPALNKASLVDALASVRRAVKEEEALGGDWRGVVDALRPVTSSFWRSLPLAEQRRFLRHLRPWWDVHRHRLAPQVADRVEAMLAKGEFAVRKGRIIRIEQGEQFGRISARVIYRPRGGGLASLTANHIINCMGPGHDPARSPCPLLRGLIEDRIGRPDALRLGLDVNAEGRLIAASDHSDHAIFALGPVVRGIFWETTAIPDIRLQAEKTAAAILSLLNAQKTRAAAGRVAAAH